MSPLRLFLAGSAACALGVWAGLSLSQVVPQPGPPTPIAGAYNLVPPTLTTAQAGWVQLDNAGNLKVNVAVGGGTGGTSSTFGAAFPAIGSAIGFTDGTNMVAGKVDGSQNLLVNCASGCSGGTFNNNADNVATSSTNGQAAAWNYVWDGATWDRLYGDSTNGAFVNVKTSVLPTGAATAAKQPALGTAGTASTDVLTVQGIAAMTPFLVTLGTETTKVIGTVRNVGNVGGVFDAVIGAAPPANGIQTTALTSGATAGLVQPIIQCDQKAIYDASTNGSTELVALTSGRTIYVCGKVIFSAGTVNVKLIYGTGTACATGSVNLTPAYQLTTQTGLVDGSPFFRGSKTASANALCINTSAGVAVQAEVYYAIL